MKYTLLSLLCLGGLSCEEDKYKNASPPPSQTELIVYKSEDGFTAKYYFRTINYKGHSYILCNWSTHSGGMEHDPNCKCFQNK